MPVGLSVDSLTVEPDEQKVSCVYRALVPAELSVRVLEVMLVLAESEASQSMAESAHG